MPANSSAAVRRHFHASRHAPLSPATHFPNIGTDMFQNNDIFPSLGSLSFAGRPIRFTNTPGLTTHAPAKKIRSFIAKLLG